jgi:NAD(P)-dependent dehydrogenase (short-subunit alcohol dehydrogenase family)
MAVYFVTGANRGLGIEFVRQLRARSDTVVAAARSGEAELTRLGARFVALDVADEQGIRSAALAIAGEPIDVLINNAGVSSKAKRLDELTADELRGVFAINATGPMLVGAALLPSLRSGRQRKIINISTQMGSIALNSPPNAGGTSYGYRSSKAALNMLTASLANELRPEGFTCIALHPGWVRTDMGGSEAPLGAPESVSSMIKLIDGLRPDQSGAFLDLHGRTLPW